MALAVVPKLDEEDIRSLKTRFSNVRACLDVRDDVRGEAQVEQISSPASERDSSAVQVRRLYPAPDSCVAGGGEMKSSRRWKSSGQPSRSQPQAPLISIGSSSTDFAVSFTLLLGTLHCMALLCLICAQYPAYRCQRCQCSAYCSTPCQETNYPARKLLCKAFARFVPDTRPSINHRLAIYAAVNER